MKRISSAKRGQAALEFLMTYGWVFLIVILTISVFAYLGVSSPNNLVPESCIGSEGYSCAEFKVNALSNTDSLQFVLINTLKSFRIESADDIFIEGFDADDYTLRPSVELSGSAESLLPPRTDMFIKQELAFAVTGAATTSAATTSAATTSAATTSAATTSSGTGGPTSPATTAGPTGITYPLVVQKNEALTINIDLEPGIEFPKGQIVNGRLVVFVLESGAEFPKEVTFDFVLKA